ncbi:MAG: Uma2 family endonuclease [Prochlorococcaceae cyanobacterium]
MTFAPLVAAPAAPEAAVSASAPPLLLPHDLRLSPEQFALVCEANPDAVLELAADGQLITMPPTGGETGRRNTRLLARLQSWADLRGGWEVSNSSTGFRLADGSVLSPDAAVVRGECWQALSLEQRRTFPPLCPDLVIELASASDSGPRGGDALRLSMDLYQAIGAQLSWLLNPGLLAVEIWPARPDAVVATEPQRLDNAMRLDGADVLPGLVLELEEIWAA